MRKSARLALFATVVCALVVPAASYGAFVSWTTPAGSAAIFDYSEGGSTDALFGEPTITPSGFWFDPPAFFSSATNGGADNTDSEMQVRVKQTAGALVEVIITETGTYTGTAGSEFSAFTDITLTQIDPFAFPPLHNVSADTYVDGVYDADGNWVLGADGSGTWVKQVTIDLTTYTAGGWNEFRLNIHNFLQTTASVGGSAYIEKTGVDVHVPEPTTVGLLALGLVGLGVRRRRNIG